MGVGKQEMWPFGGTSGYRKSKFFNLSKEKSDNVRNNSNWKLFADPQLKNDMIMQNIIMKNISNHNADMHRS